MGEHTSNELAYKKGYEAGYRDGKDRVMGDIAFHKLLERPPERSREELEYLMQSPVVLIKDTESINQIYPYSRWIPVTERLPEIPDGRAEHPDPVLYMMKSTKTIYAGYYGEGGIWRDKYFREYADSRNGVDADDVLCWMWQHDLPEPPKGE